MASSEISSPKLFAREIAAYSDAELDQYLTENGRFVNVEDHENLPDDFIQRLRDRTRRVSETGLSQPIDLDQVAARLHEHSRRSPSIATTASQSPDPAEEHREDLRRQTGYYKMLVDDGGRPSHPLSRLVDIVEDPRDCREILSFWQGKHSDKSEWRVFETQLWRWKDFRGLQRFARGQRGYDYWRSLWDERCAMWGFHSPWMADVGTSEEHWGHYWRLYNEYENCVQLGTSYMPWQRFIKRTGHIADQQGFSAYAEALKERLARHGFTRSFQLDEDAARQDKMTTWIEYLGYEYWWYDYYAGIARSHQKRHGNAWKKLVDSNVLRPGETEEFICNIDAIFQRSSQNESAERAVKSAKLALSSAEAKIAKWRQSKLSPQTLRQRLLEARSNLETTQAEYESLKRHSDCIHEFILRTQNYRIAKSDTDRHEVLLQWMLQQVPLIEAELDPPNEHRLDNGGQKSLLKRKRNQLDELVEHLPEQSCDGYVRGSNADPIALAVASFQEPPSKRPRRTPSLSNNPLFNLADRNLVSKAVVATGECDPPKENGQAAIRRSARIAKRADRSDAGITTINTDANTSAADATKKRKGKRDRTEIAHQRRTSKPRGTSKRFRTYP